MKFGGNSLKFSFLINVKIKVNVSCKQHLTIGLNIFWELRCGGVCCCGGACADGVGWMGAGAWPELRGVGGSGRLACWFGGGSGTTINLCGNAGREGGPGSSIC